MNRYYVLQQVIEIVYKEKYYQKPVSIIRLGEESHINLLCSKEWHPLNDNVIPYSTNLECNH